MQKALADIRAAQGEPILLKGEGDAFSAGLNIKEIAMLEPAALETFLTLFDTLVVTLLSHDAPVVACVNGHAIAGGCVLALCCDIRVSTKNPATRIGLNEVAIGLMFPPRILKLAKSRLAPSHLSRIILEGGLYPPTEALRLGLVHEIDYDPDAAARNVLSRLSENPRAAYVDAKRDLNRAVIDLDPHETEAFKSRVLPFWTSPELRQTVAMTLMKRAADKG
jgi:enoyl-CoA hydratase